MNYDLFKAWYPSKIYSSSTRPDIEQEQENDVHLNVVNVDVQKVIMKVCYTYNMHRCTK